MGTGLILFFWYAAFGCAFRTILYSMNGVVKFDSLLDSDLFISQNRKNDEASYSKMFKLKQEITRAV